MEDLALDILVKFPGIKKKKIQTGKKNPSGLTLKEEGTNGHQTSQVQ